MPEDRGAAGLWTALKRANCGVRVLFLVAHPDDEDAATLTWLARREGADVTLLSLTRGEAGANLITADFFDELGALRTLEHRKAAELYGVRVRYTSFADFGYSKDVEETWRNWDRKLLFKEVQDIVNEVRPHIVMARFTGTPRDGHGQHQASGLMATDAFEKPGSWTPLKLYLGGDSNQPATRIQINTGEYDPVSGRSYAEIGREGYRWHRSQAMGAVLARPGKSAATYTRAGSRTGGQGEESSIFDGLRIVNPAAAEARRALESFSAQNPAASAPYLAEGLRNIQRLRQAHPEDPDLREWEERFSHALELALGLEAEVLVESDNPVNGPAAMFRPAVTFRVAAAGQSFQVATSFYVRGPVHVAELSRRVTAPRSWEVSRLDAERFKVRVRDSAAWSAAPWSRPSIRLARYTETGTAEPPLMAEIEYEYLGARGRVRRTAEVSYLDSVGLQHREPVAVGPAISVKFASAAGFSPLSAPEYPVDVIVRNSASGPRQGTIRLELPPGWTSKSAAAGFRFEREGEEARFTFPVTPTAQAGTGVIHAVAESGGHQYRRSFERITYSGLDSIYLSHPAEHRVQRVDVKVAPGLRAGYVMGTGDEVPAALRRLGVPVTLLDSNALASGDLAQYSVILLGIRAYAAREDLRVHNARLLEYVRNGGTLIVQYNTQEFDKNFGPYPYTMTSRAEEVSEEDSPVTILDPDHVLFRSPNVIDVRDFEGWFEQRGSKFWMTWDDRYKPLIETHDTGQAPQKGIWLAADYGKGKYVYCALAWYRQLPVAAPGAVRLFANLISLGAR